MLALSLNLDGMRTQLKLREKFKKEVSGRVSQVLTRGGRVCRNHANRIEQTDTYFRPTISTQS